MLILAMYGADGRYVDMLCADMKSVTTGGVVNVTLPVNNQDGEIANLKAFVISSMFNVKPMGNSVCFIE
jgi:hypothetical protein